MQVTNACAITFTQSEFNLIVVALEEKLHILTRDNPTAYLGIAYINNLINDLKSVEYELTREGDE